MVRESVFSCICIVIVLAFGGQVVWASLQEDEAGRFLESLDTMIPPDLGRLVVTYEVVGNAAGIKTVGYDAIDDAWFISSFSGCAGRAIDSWMYRASPNDSELQDMAPFFAEMIAISKEIPWGYLLAMRDRPEMVLSAQLGDDGVWTVEFHAVHPDQVTPERVPWAIRVEDATGHVLRAGLITADASSGYTYDWEGTGLGLLISDGGSMMQQRTRLDFDADSDEFLPDRVFQRMHDYRIRVQNKLNALSSGYVQDEAGEWVPTESASDPTPITGGSRFSRWRVFLFIGGGMIILIGLVQGIRQHAAR